MSKSEWKILAKFVAPIWIAACIIGATKGYIEVRKEK